MTRLLEDREEEHSTALPARLESLGELVRLGEDRLDDDLLEDVRAVLSRAGERLRLSGEHTVIALAGTTGSGKSSLFNALAGIDLSPVGVRRPTTGAAHACVWGLDGAGSLLQWLGIESRHRYARTSALDTESGSSYRGLVLLDLPDHDSTAQEHRLEADRLVSAADLVVWVVDPQKYADAAVHDRYLRRSAGHASVTAVVLNKVDVLSREASRECLDDLRNLLASEGLSHPRVLATSASSGAGLDDFRELIDETLARRRAAVERLEADLDEVVGWLAPYAEAEPVGIDSAGRSTVVDELSEAVGVDAAARAAERERWRRGIGLVGGPLLLAARGSHGDPFRRARLGHDASEELRTARADRVSAQPAMVRSTVRSVPETLTGELPQPWLAAVDRAARAREKDLPGAVGDALAGVPAENRLPRWWWAAGVLQWVLALYAFAGIAWSACIVAFGYARADLAVPPILRDTSLLPYAILALVEALVAGAAIAWVTRRGVRNNAASRRAAVSAQATERVEAAAEELVFGPVQRELDRYAQFHRVLELAKATSDGRTWESE